MNFTLKKSRTTKRIRISVHADGKVVVSAPRLVPDFLVRQFVNSKKDWIEEKVEYFKKLEQMQPGFSMRSRMTQKDKKKEYVENKDKALVLVHKRLEYFNQHYNFVYKNVTIRNQKTRWGSCSKRGNLNFNYKIALVPPELQDYIVIHELCHLKEHNHSRNFWALVEQKCTDWRECKARLKKY